jgi:hypothetical protein
VRIRESTALFIETMDRIEVISQMAPVLVSAKPLTSISSPRLGLLSELRKRASHIWEEGPAQLPLDSALQPSLFGDTFTRNGR